MPVKYKGILNILFDIFYSHSQRLWSCIFRNWSLLGLKMYIFLTLDFTLL